MLLTFYLLTTKSILLVELANLAWSSKFEYSSRCELPCAVKAWNVDEPAGLEFQMMLYAS